MEETDCLALRQPVAEGNPIRRPVVDRGGKDASQRGAFDGGRHLRSAQEIGAAADGKGLRLSVQRAERGFDLLFFCLQAQAAFPVFFQGVGACLVGRADALSFLFQGFFLSQQPRFFLCAVRSR